MAEKKTPSKPVKGGVDATDTKAAPKPATPAKSGAASAKSSRSTKDKVKDEANKIGKQAADRARGYANDGKAKATGALDEVAKMMKEAAGSVDDRLGSEYGKYAHNAAGSVSNFADTLRGRDVDDLIDDLRDFVRKSPAIALGTAAAVGFVLARIVKAGIDGSTDTTGDD